LNFWQFGALVQAFPKAKPISGFFVLQQMLLAKRVFSRMAVDGICMARKTSDF
jgi:hypothetical protein